MNYQNNQSGFSLVETVIAIGILATVVGSMIALQTSVVRILQFSTEKQKATLVLKSTMAQLDFLTEKDGFNAYPEPDEPKIWQSKLNSKFTNSISTSTQEVKLSQLLLSAVQMYYMGKDENANPELIKIMFTAVGDNLDRSVDEEASLIVDISTIWPEGKEKQKISQSLFLINSDAIESTKIFN